MEVPLSEQVRTQVLLAGQRVATSETDSERSARTSFPKVEGTVNKLEIQSFSSHGCILLRVAPAEWHRVVWGPLEQTQLPLIKAGVGRGPQAEKKGAALHLWAGICRESLPSHVRGCVFGLTKRVSCP